MPPRHQAGQVHPERRGFECRWFGVFLHRIDAPDPGFKIITGLGVAIAAIVLPMSAGASVSTAGAAEAHTVPIDCAAQGVPDSRSAYDASVQPGVIVPTVYGDGIPTTYTAYGWDAQTNSAQTIGPTGEVATTDHLVAAWMNSTDCFGASQGIGDASPNAWVVDSTGHVFGESNLSGPPANNFGDASGIHLNQPIVGMTPTSDGQGSWLVASDGGIFTYGDAQFYGSTGSIRLNQPIVGMSVTSDGNGYTLVAADGGVFNFGDSQFYGSIPGVLKPGQKLNSPIEGIVNTPDGGGYWMVAADGGVFTFGDASFLGSLGSEHLASPIAGMFAHGTGYSLVAQDGTLYPFAGPPPVVLVFGDSLMSQSQGYVDYQFGLLGVNVLTQDYGGTALCDWIPTILADAAFDHPTAVVLEFSGNALTHCMAGVTTEAQDAAKYQADTDYVISQLAPMGIEVILVSAPPTIGPNGTGEAVGSPSTTQVGLIPTGYVQNPDLMTPMYEQVASTWRLQGVPVGFVDAGAAVATSSRGWTYVLPCLSFETVAMGCTNGLIIVRAADLHHFCPGTFGAPNGVAPSCSVWSSGEWRYASAITGYTVAHI